MKMTLTEAKRIIREAGGLSSLTGRLYDARLIQAREVVLRANTAGIKENPRIEVKLDDNGFIRVNVI